MVRLVVAGIAIVSALAAASAASAALPVCGETKPATGEVARATLSLDQEKSFTSLRLERSTQVHQLTLEYSVGGCTVNGRPPFYVRILPRGSSQGVGQAINLSTDNPPDWET